ncbi:hypothetical protein H0O00_03640 [Candidatus Micrarchaeota archaeon]|nr:hypothetical protein [Candidatus Micrarchaeota archaeon]
MVKKRQRIKGRKPVKAKPSRKKGKHSRQPSNKSKMSKVRKLKRLAGKGRR